MLDTNVLMPAVFGRGVCEALLDVLLERDDATVVLSEHILAEFAEHATRKFKVPADAVDRAIAAIRDTVETVEPSGMPPDTCPDADDLPVLGTAVAASASHLVTGDAELLALGRIESTPIVTPRAMYDWLLAHPGRR